MKLFRVLSILLLGMILIYSCDSGSTTSTESEPEPPPSLTDEELMDLVQEQTFKYFFEFAESGSGMALERSNGSSTLVTTGGTGFGLASFPAAVERGWITEQEAIDRLRTMLTFLETVPTYHGAFSHWYDGESATTIPFSDLDDGGDLVETSFLMQGLLINRQYFDDDSDAHREIRDRITTLWEAVEWTWYQQEGNNVLTWHWSPRFGFEIDLDVTGWNEALMTYVLAASSPTFPIEPEVYHRGWARNGDIQNGNTFFDETLPLGQDFGGPLFFAHYSFIGLNPNGLEDRYTNYFEQNRAHTLINFEYCAANPNDFPGYSEQSWGLTASDDPREGYAIHSPTNDLGVITPTAAVSSIPYTPERSLAAMRHFYEDLNDDLWGPYGFHDAFSPEFNWVANSFLAIDQGPIIAMIENHRTGLLWDLFMSDPEVKDGLILLGFSSPEI